MYNNECKPCQEGALPTIYDRAVTHSTDDSTACETSWTSPTRSLTRSASLKDGMIIVMTKIDADGKLEGNCTWCSLIEDGGVLPEGQATEAAGKCEIIKKNKVAEIMVCHIPEAAGDALTAGWSQDPMGVHCQIFWTGTMSQLICNYVG
ncbi:hypothetical protein SLS61_006105 [Didymella pomorum]